MSGSWVGSLLVGPPLDYRSRMATDTPPARASFVSKAIATFVSPAFAKFLVVGVINSLNGVVLAWLYSLVLDANTAFVLGYLTSLTISYFLNSIFVFQRELAPARYVKFCLSYIPNFLIQNLCVVVVYNLLGFDKLVAYVAAVVIGAPITFLVLKFFAFAQHKVVDLETH